MRSTKSEASTAATCRQWGARLFARSAAPTGVGAGSPRDERNARRRMRRHSQNGPRFEPRTPMNRSSSKHSSFAKSARCSSVTTPSHAMCGDACIGNIQKVNSHRSDCRKAWPHRQLTCSRASSRREPVRCFQNATVSVRFLTRTIFRHDIPKSERCEGHLPC